MNESVCVWVCALDWNEEGKPNKEKTDRRRTRALKCMKVRQA